MSAASTSLFEGQEHAKLYRKYREVPPPSVIQRVISYLKEEYSGQLEQAVDLGCGSGQCSFLLADHFNKVLGQDVSAAQVGQAREEGEKRGCQHVEFKLGPAETIGLPNGSVQLVTACTAAHWFDLPKVYEEGARVLCKNGVMAFLSVESMEVRLEGKEEESRALQEVVREVTSKYLRPYFAPNVELWYNKYKDIVIPYRDLVREFGLGRDVSYKVSVTDILGYVRSFSAFQTCFKDKAEEGDRFIEGLKNRLLSASGLSASEVSSPLLTRTNPYMLVMGRI